MGEIFSTIIVTPITNILLAIYHLLVALHIPSPLGFSIILLTVLIRLAIYPLTASQLKASKKMQTVSPHLAKLKEKHKKDAARLQKETMALYKEHGINPVAGCLPVILQLPIIWGLYSVLQHIVALKPEAVVSTVNKIAYSPSLYLTKPWDNHFLGLPLGTSPSHLFATLGIFVALIPLFTAVFQFIQAKMMLPVAPVETTSTKKKATEPDFATAFQAQSMYMLPLMIGFFSFQFPVGLSLYWNTFTIFGIIQQYKISGLGGLAQWIDFLKTIKK